MEPLRVGAACASVYLDQTHDCAQCAGFPTGRVELMTVRSVVVWCPDWPAVAAAREQDIAAHVPVAVIAAGRVRASTATARTHGVMVGVRVREAQARCPDIAIARDDPVRDVRAFERIVSTVEQIVPGVEVLRPGLCVMTARGAARYFGGEQPLAEALIDHLAAHADAECHIGIADEVFTASIAARTSSIVKPNCSKDFLGDKDVVLLGKPDLVGVLRRLGIHTLGAFAALPAAQVRDRFGRDVQRLHQLVNGYEERVFTARIQPPELTVSQDFDPPLTRVAGAVFAARGLAEKFHGVLAAHQCACTRLVIGAHTGDGQELTRTWRHEGALSAEAIADRVRWQLDAWLSRGSSGALVSLSLSPDGVVEANALQGGLWGELGEHDKRAHRALSAVQGIVGAEGVVTAVPTGGRQLIEAVELVPWGESRTPQRDPGLPWPGRLPPPWPATVYAAPVQARLENTAGELVTVTARHALTGEPARCRIGREASAITAWAGPWPVRERWWVSPEMEHAWMQVCREIGPPLLLSFHSGSWWVEAVYD